MRMCVFVGAAAGLLAVCGTALAQLPNGVAAGDTTQNSTVLWARSLSAGNVNFEVATGSTFLPGNVVQTASTAVTDTLVPARASIAGLLPGTQYSYRATDASGASLTGVFRTPAASGRNGMRFGVSGDYRGDVAPFAFGRNIASRNLDLYVSLGDTVYADVASPGLPGVPQAQTLNQFRTKHAENLSPVGGLNGLADIRRSTSTLAMIDDHEVTNDFQGYATVSTDSRFTFGGAAPTDRINRTPLFANGLQAFQDYHPMEQRTYSNTGTDPRTDGLPELYRSRRYGQDAQIIVTDARSFRDRALPGVANPTDPAQVGAFLVQSFDPTRTMLGQRQLTQVQADLLSAQQSGVTWKFVHVPQPTQNFGVVGAPDRFEGYAAERAALLSFIRTNNIENVVFVAADVHGTSVNNLTYQNGPGQAQITTNTWEISTGSGAYAPPFGPTLVGIGAQLGALTPAQVALYNSLPTSGGPFNKEDFIQNLINAQIVPQGYNPIGLNGSTIPATLLSGSWTATHTFGWTEFDIDAVTQALTVTTYGIPWYPAGTDPSLIVGLNPTIVQQFVVQAVPTPAAVALLGLGGLVATRRRRR